MRVTRRGSAGTAGIARIARIAALAALTLLAAAACATLDFSAPRAGAPLAAFPETSFAVFSDPHMFLPELGIGEPGFERIKYSDRKMFEHSRGLLDAVIGKIPGAHPRFVLVPGDLTKDGEEAVHLAFANAMEELRSSGIRVYVVPGNHDVNNPGAVRYEGARKARVANVTPARFAEIYRDFGYAEAIERDPSSLAYVAEPEPGLWLLALDACSYERNLERTEAYAGGFFTPERLGWVRKVLERARAENKAVIVLMHHGVVEHFPGQAKQFPDYLMEDREGFSRMLAEYGVRTVFTGHFHSQNIAGTWFADGSTGPQGARFLFDIETGSLVTWPSPWRLVQIDAGQVMHVRSSRIDSIPEMPTGFPDYALDYARRGTIPYIVKVLRGYGISPQEAERIALPISAAAIAHYAGDPDPRGVEMYPTKNLSLMGSLAVAMKRDIIEGMWKGALPHADSDIDIDLAAGTWRGTERD